MIVYTKYIRVDHLLFLLWRAQYIALPGLSWDPSEDAPSWLDDHFRYDAVAGVANTVR